MLIVANRKLINLKTRTPVSKNTADDHPETLKPARLSAKVWARAFNKVPQTLKTRTRYCKKMTKEARRHDETSSWEAQREG